MMKEIQKLGPPLLGRGNEGEVFGTSSSISFSEGEGAVLKNEAQLLVLPHQQRKIVEQ